MRYPAEHKKETHERIVRKAAEAFRRHGFDGTGIAALMGALGLTHGGFYAHFRTKDDLIDEACASIMEENLARMVAAGEAAQPGNPVQAILDHYLSPQHRDDPGSGCLLPALASELARLPASSRSGFTASLNSVFGRIAELMPGDTAEARRERAMVLLSAMAGTVLLARAVSDRELSDRLLRSGHEFLSGSFVR